jgi:quercetin dioxygenase-like cupin family protein
MRQIGYVALAVGLAMAGAVQAQDVMKVAPEHYRVLVENKYVRVVQNTLAPGQKDSLHTHPPGWYYVTDPGRMRVVFASGRTELWTPAAGEAGWSTAESAHTSENVGDIPMSYVLVEVKAARPVRHPRVALFGRGGH